MTRIRIKDVHDADIRHLLQVPNEDTGELETVRYVRVSNPLNYNYQNHINEVNYDPSETEPDQTMGLREILVRYARGLPIAGASVYYDGEADENGSDFIPEEAAIDFKNLDLAERQALAEQAAANVKNLRSTLKSTIDEARKKSSKSSSKSKSDTVDQKDEKPDQGTEDEEPKSKS